MEEKTGLARVLNDVFTEEDKVIPAPPSPTLKEQLVEVLKEAPTMDTIIKNPWMHDVFVRKVKALVE